MHITQNVNDIVKKNKFQWCINKNKLIIIKCGCYVKWKMLFVRLIFSHENDVNLFY